MAFCGPRPQRSASKNSGPAQTASARAKTTITPPNDQQQAEEQLKLAVMNARTAKKKSKLNSNRGYNFASFCTAPFVNCCRIWTRSPLCRRRHSAGNCPVWPPERRRCAHCRRRRRLLPRQQRPVKAKRPIPRNHHLPCQNKPGRRRLRAIPLVPRSGGIVAKSCRPPMNPPGAACSSYC